MNNRKKDYAEFNKALDRLISAGDRFNEPAVQTATISDKEDFLNGTEPHLDVGTGTLTVQVSMANGAVPIQGAKVTIMGNDGNVLYTYTTDNSGKTPKTELSAPAASYSQSPGNIIPYATYNVRVEKDGFYTEDFLNIAVFAGIDSIQGVSLDPLGENANEDDRITINEAQPDNL